MRYILKPALTSKNNNTPLKAVTSEDSSGGCYSIKNNNSILITRLTSLLTKQPVEK